MECGGLNVIGLHNLMGSGTIRRYDFVGIGMVFVGESMSLQ